MKTSHLVGVALALVVVGGVAFAWMRWGRGASPCPGGATHTITMVVVSSPSPTISVPPYETVCPGDTVVWEVKNDCQTCGHNQKVHVRIDNRARRNKTSCSDVYDMSDPVDPFKEKQSHPCKPEHATIAYGTTETLGDCTVKDKSTVHNGCYKYWLKGTFDIDPEVEVQGGLPFRDDLEPPMSPSPQVTPSPAASPAN